MRLEHSFTHEVTNQSQFKNSSSQPPSELSFLNIHALNQSFLDKSSSSESSSSGESFDRSSESNPYGTSSESEDNSYDIKEKDKANKLQSLLSIEKSNKNINVLLQIYLAKEMNFPDLSENTSKLIKKLNLAKFDMLFFFIAATIKYREDDANILRDKLRFEFLDKSMSKSPDSKLHSILQQITGESKHIDKDTVVQVFIEHSAYFLQRVLEDKDVYYDLFIEIIASGEINAHSLYNKIFIQTSTLNRVLSEKKYPQLLYLVSNNIRIMHNQLINFNIKEDQFTFEGYLNKPLLKINLKLYAIYYTTKSKDFNFIKKFLFDVRQSIQEYSELLKVFLASKANSLAKETFKALADSSFSFDNKLIYFTLKVQNYEFLWFLAHHPVYSVSNWLQEEECQKTLVEYLLTSEGKNFEYTLYFLKRVKRLKSKQTIKRMSEILISRLYSSRQGQFLYTFYNPLKISLLIVEFMQQTIPNVMHHKNRLQKALDLYYRFAQIYCSLITEDTHLIEIFKDTDLERRKLIYLIDANKSAIIQATQNVEDAIESLWNGNIAPKNSIIKMFSVTQTLFHEDLSDYLIEKDPKKNEIFLTVNKSYTNHHFSLQRVVWTYNCRIRNQIDQCLILILMLLIFINFSNLFEPQLEIQTLRSKEDNPDLELNELGYVQDLQSRYFQFQIYIDIIIGLNFTCKPLFILYYDTTQQVQTIFNAQDFNGFVLGIFSIFQLIFVVNMQDIQEPERFNIMLNFRWIYIAITMLQVIHAIRNFKVFGPMIKALWLVVLECSKLFFIFLIVMLLFGFCGYFSFYENTFNRFKSLGSTMLFLIEALFGQFNFNEFNVPPTVYAPIFLNVYLFFSPIIFMQLIVAVLTFTFETASRSGRVHYYLGIIENLKNLEYDPVCGCLVSIPIIGSFFNIIFIFTHLFSDPDPLLKESNLDFLKRVNRVLTKCAYYPIYGVLTLVCLVLVILCTPLLYVVKALRILNEPHGGKGYSRAKRFFTWILLGFYFMIRESIEDFKRNYTYLMHGKFLNDSPQVNISNTLYSIVASTAKDFFLKTREHQNKVILSDYLSAVIKKMKSIEQKQAEKLRREQELQARMLEQSDMLSNTNNNNNRDNQTITAADQLLPAPTANIAEQTAFNDESSSPLRKQKTHFFSEKTLPQQEHSFQSHTNFNFESNRFQNHHNSNNNPNNNNNNNQPLQKKDSLLTSQNHFANRIRSLINAEETEVNQQPAAQDELEIFKKQTTLYSSEYSGNSNNQNGIPQLPAIPNLVHQPNVPPGIHPHASKPGQQNQAQPSTGVPQIQQNARTKPAPPSIIFEVPQETGSITEMGPDFLPVLPSRATRTSILLEEKNKIQHQSEPTLPRRSSMRHPMIEKQFSQPKSNTPQIANAITAEEKKKKLDRINFEILEEPTKDDDEQQKRRPNYTRHLSSGSNTAKHSNMTSKHSHHASQLQAYENQVHQRKRQKTTYQMWKKMKKEDNSSGGNIIKDTDQLYQFLDAFVVDEEEQGSQDQNTTSKTEIEDDSNDWIYIENLLKLMYHYSKNDVKLARFNILFQSIKKLLKEE